MSNKTQEFKGAGILAVAACLGLFTCGAAMTQDQNRDHKNDQRQQQRAPEQRAPQERAPQQRLADQPGAQQHRPQSQQARQNQSAENPRGGAQTGEAPRMQDLQASRRVPQGEERSVIAEQVHEIAEAGERYRNGALSASNKLVRLLETLR